MDPEKEQGAPVDPSDRPAVDLTEIIERGRVRRPVNDLTEDEILGYGDDGLPQ
ncbi:MAG: hypothetical protein Q4G67_15405 [Actinomycetia bacterium]|nr:hypothetical protein [Actinomycetes bacterium]